MKYLFTSEAVSEGHPDKICDKIADKILDEAIKKDKNSKMAVEATIKDNLVLIYGEANTKAEINYEKIALEVLKDIGYKEEYQIITKISKQSPEINKKVAQIKTKAGDQGIMFGYACNETKELMPLPIMIANKIMITYDQMKKSNDNLGPDAKCQVTIEYQNDFPLRIDTVILSFLVNDRESNYYDLAQQIINISLPSELADKKTNIIINPFYFGGSFADSGTTGRKIVCDTYGGSAKVGGGCFSSKDPSKVDRSAAYYARYVCKNVVYYKLCSKCEIQVSYVIGQEKPISLFIDTFNTNNVPIQEIYDFVNKNFDFSVNNIIKELDLLRPIYYNLAAHGHFGREELNLSFEKIKNVL